MMNYYTGRSSTTEIGLVADLLDISDEEFISLEEDVQIEGLASKAAEIWAKAKKTFGKTGKSVAKSAYAAKGRAGPQLSREQRLQAVRDALSTVRKEAPAEIRAKRNEMELRGSETRQAAKKAYKQRTADDADRKKIKDTPIAKLLAVPPPKPHKPGEFVSFKRPLPRMAAPKSESYNPFYSPRVQRLIEALRS